MGGSNSKCSSCNVNVATDTLFSHTQQNHPLLVCQFCEEIFNSQNLQKYHMVQHHPECKICNQYFATMQSLEDHKQNTHLPVVCLVCKVEFTKEQIPLCKNCQIRISAKEDWTAYIRQSYPHYDPHVIGNPPSNRSSIYNSYETKRAQEVRLEKQRIEQQRQQLLRNRQEELRLQREDEIRLQRASEIRLQQIRQQEQQEEQQRIQQTRLQQQRLQQIRQQEQEQQRLQQQQREVEARSQRLQQQRQQELQQEQQRQREAEARSQRLQQQRQQELQREQQQQQREAEVRLQQQRLQLIRQQEQEQQRLQQQQREVEARSQQRLQQQRQINNRNQESCDLCGSRFHTLVDKNEHIEIVHKQCSTCSKQFQNKNQLRKHILMAHPYCLICEHPKEYDLNYSGKRYETAVDLQKHVAKYHSAIFLKPKKFFSNFKCSDCNSGWKSALTWGIFLPYPQNHPRYDVYYENSDDEDDYYDNNNSLGVFNNRLRFQTRNAENELGEIFIFFPQDCRNCGNSCMPFKCTYLTCSRCKQDVRNCSCPRAHKKTENYNENAPHRQDLCSRCAYLGQGCWLNQMQSF